MPEITLNLRLTGGRTGKTVVLGGYQFVDGMTVVVGNEKSVPGIVKYLGRTYKAFPEGSRELKHASDIQEGSESGTSAQVQSGSEPGNRPVAEVPADIGSGTDGGPEGDTGSVPTRNGHQDPRKHQYPSDADRVLEAVTSLDRSDDECWTVDGLPRVDAVSKATGIANLTREKIEAVVPGPQRG